MEFNSSDQFNEDANSISNALMGIINSTTDLIWSVNSQFCYTYFNDRFREYLISNYNTIPEIGNKIISASSDLPELKYLFKMIQKGFEGEFLYEEISLPHLVAQVNVNPIFNEKKEIIGSAIYCRDITISKINELKLKESENRYKDVIESVHEIIFQTDIVGNWSFLNKSWERVFGFKVEDCLGKPFFGFLHPDDVQKNMDLFEPLIQRKKNFCDHEIRYITSTGKVLNIRVYAVIRLNESDEIIGTSGTLQDITEQKRNKEMYQLLSENVRDLIVLHTMAGNISYITPSCYTLLGYHSDELIGTNPFNLVHPDDIRNIQLLQQSIIDGGNQNTLISYRFKHKNGTYHWLETNSKLMTDSQGNPSGIIASSRIVDERKKLEENLIESLVKEKELNELKSRFVSMASHEFRTPMATIKSSTEILEIRIKELKNETTVESFNKHLQIINSEIDRLTFLMNDVLLLGKIEADKVVFKPESTNVIELIQDIIKRQENKQTDGRKIIFEFTGKPHHVMIDPSQFNHILDNLISNAYKYSIGEKSPELTLHFKNKSIKLELRDYGIGVPKEEEKQLFVSFFRARNADIIQGTGLGLVIVKNFVTMHGGKITFQSENIKGTIFTVELPY